MNRFRVTLIISWLLLTGCCTSGVAAPVSGGPSTATLVRHFREEHGLEVLVDRAPVPAATRYGVIAGLDAAPNAVESFLQLLAPEWSLYPPALVRRIELKRIILCRNLSFAGQRRGAVPDFEHHDLYFDVETGRGFPEYVRKVIHHEVYHIIDWYDDFSLYADLLWGALNDPGVMYGSGGKNAQADGRGSLLNSQLPGFLNTYSMAGVEEDKAEVFANLLVSQAYVLDRGRRDRVLYAKILRMKMLMWRFVPELDLEFWSRAAALPRPSGENLGGLTLQN